MAILLREPAGPACLAALTAETEVVISAGTVAEALIVADRRNLGAEMARLIDEFGFTIVPVMYTTATRMAEAYQRWGAGIHPAALNFGDCFAYAVARENACPLLFVGEDFSRTDLVAAL